MNRRAVVWVDTPDEDESDWKKYIIFRVTADWFATDADQLLLPIKLLERDGNELDPTLHGILKQYGGEGLLNDMLLADQDLEQGSTWYLQRTPEGISVEPHPTD